MIAIVPNNAATFSGINAGLCEVEGIDTGGGNAVFNDSGKDEKLCIKIWCRDEKNQLFYIAINQEHFKEVFNCINFAAIWGYIVGGE